MSYSKKDLFPNGLPVHDTIFRIVSRLDPGQFRQVLAGTTAATTDPEQVLTEAGHGRYEAREYHVLRRIPWQNNFQSRQA